MKLYDVEKLSTHGGSLRVYATHHENNRITISKGVDDLLNEEKKFGLLDTEVYEQFAVKVNKIKYDLLAFLLQAKQEGKKVAAYGAAAKGNTLLNYAGVKNDLIEFVVDKSPYKQGKYLPASHIPIVEEDRLGQTKPDYIFIFPWNIQDEITKQLEYVKKWGCKFVVAIPEVKVL